MFPNSSNVTTTGVFVTLLQRSPMPQPCPLLLLLFLSPHQSRLHGYCPKCINCAGPHTSYSAACPLFTHEQEICHFQTSASISFLDARSRVAEAHAKRPNTPRGLFSTYHQLSLPPSSTSTTPSPPLMSLALDPPPAISSTTPLSFSLSLSYNFFFHCSYPNSSPSHGHTLWCFWCFVTFVLYAILDAQCILSSASLLSFPTFTPASSKFLLPTWAPLPPWPVLPCLRFLLNLHLHCPSLPTIDLTSLLTKLLPLFISLSPLCYCYHW